MKLRERYFDQDGKLIVEQTHDPRPYLSRAKAAKDVDAGFVSDGWHVASLPAYLVNEECRKRGVRLDDHDAVQEVLFDLINDSDYRHFRVREGRV